MNFELNLAMNAQISVTAEKKKKNRFFYKNFIIYGYFGGKTQLLRCIVVPLQNNTALAAPRRILDTVFGLLPCLILN